MGDSRIATTLSAPGAAEQASPLEQMEALLADHAARGMPPVEAWNPPARADIGMEIDHDGTWLYQGGPILRTALVRLFASVLRRDDDGYWLVTPVERVPIKVAGAPFVAVEMSVRNAGAGQALLFRTNLDDVVVANSNTPLRFDGDPRADGFTPFVTVRRGLEARLSRAVYYELVELCEIEDRPEGRFFGIRSDGHFFAVAPAGVVEDIGL